MANHTISWHWNAAELSLELFISATDFDLEPGTFTTQILITDMDHFFNLHSGGKLFWEKGLNSFTKHLNHEIESHRLQNASLKSYCYIK